MKTFKMISTIAVLSVAMLVSSVTVAGNNKKGRGSEGSPTVYVISQGLYYDSIVLGDLPMQGSFQQLIPTEMGLTTEYGPGEVGHRGGRWWIDMNDDGEMNSGDKFFLCPLLGPGRESL
jgi:hypothetical protein